ncbi:MAG: amidase [Gammaproteobacteria bacterium]|nr:amidase [Gammaproteobacteria bacterium]
MSDELTARGMVAVADAIRAGEISSVECTRACLSRITRLQPRTNAFIRIDEQTALEAAAHADEARARGDSLGPLHGVPLAHKDLLYRAGKVSTGGSQILRGQVASVTATAADRMDRAGAVDLGTLNMAEFAAGGTGHNAHYGDCRNPWDPSRATGGSSSGSGCAVAARMVYAALGSDTGGSVRLPAALCGITGLKPSDGRVSRFGVMPRSWTTDTLGPMARSARDVARLLGVIAGHDPHDPTTRPEPVPDYEAGLDRPIDDLRLGVANGAWWEGVDSDVGAMLDEVRRCLQTAGCRSVSIDLPSPAEAFDLAEIIVKSEAASLHERWLRERAQDYSVAIRAPIEAGLFISAARYLQALRLRGPHLAEFEATVFSKVDLLLLPVVPQAAPRLTDCDPNSPERAARTMAEFPRFTRPISYLGLPAMVMPGGFSADALPLAFQLVAPMFAESRLLRVGHHFQQMTDWHDRMPPL